MTIWSVRLLLGLVVYLGLSPFAAAQQDRRSANTLITGCQYLVDDPIAVTQPQMEEADICAGSVASVLKYGRELLGTMALCPPRGTEASDAARVIVMFLKAHPNRMNERFDVLSYGALRQAWPCR